MCIHTKCRSAADFEPDSCVRFAMNFPINAKIVVSRENLGGGLVIFFLHEGATCLEKNIAVQGRISL